MRAQPKDSKANRTKSNPREGGTEADSAHLEFPELMKQAGTPGPELFIGLIGAVGTNTRLVTSCLEGALARVNYRMQEVHAIEQLSKFEGWGPKANPVPVDEYYNALSAAGNEFRATVEARDVMALLAMTAIREKRLACDGSIDAPSTRTAYVIRSLKTPTEVNTLREVYGKSFIALAAYAPKDARRHFLRERIAESHQNDPVAINVDELTSTLLGREETGRENSYGQQLEATFPLADFFVEVGASIEALQKSIRRIVELAFGNFTHAPTRDEYGMFHAVSAGVRSASLARQVGASICTAEGELIALGCNDVPKAGGGLYWEGDEGDSRDHLRGYDSNDVMKQFFLRDVLTRLQKSGWLKGELEKLDERDLFEQAMSPNSLIRQAELMKIIEYGRSVHAEMSALMDAAKRGIAVEGCTLYSTTFPCHNCAKHIVASGIKRVVYVEPYPKSFTHRLYSDSVWVDGAGEAGKVIKFEPFVGISFRQYFSLFSMGGIERKINGTLTQWIGETASPRYYEHHSAYLAREAEVLKRFEGQLRRAGLQPQEEGFWGLLA
ncbi:MAG: anti-phage dCTP deaminase [Verrucomicrobiota bacterium]